VKVLAPHAGGTAAAERFRREARSLARLVHPNIVAIVAFGETAGTVWLAMDWIDGVPLDRLAGGGRLPAAEAVAIVRQVAGAIAHAHREGIVHRDLKPSNVLVERSGKAWVVDFGLARDRDASRDLTRSGHVLGSPAYMSPEQARGEAARIGPATDIYALGAVLYECLAGRPPFHGLNLAETLRAVLDDDPVPPRRLVPSIPRDLEAICRKAMEKDPHRRYGSAGEVLDDLDRYVEGRPVSAHPPSLPGIALRAALRHRRGLAAGLVLAALAAIGLHVLAVPWGPSTDAGLFAAAREMERAGEPAAALALYDRLARGPGILPRGFTREEVEWGRFSAAVEAARGLEAAGKTGEARRILEDGVGRLGIEKRNVSLWPRWPEVAALLWTLTGLQDLDGDRPAALATLDVLRPRLPHDRARAPAVSDGDRMAGEIRRALREGSPSRRRGALLLAARIHLEGWLPAGALDRELLVGILAVEPDVIGSLGFRSPVAPGTPAATCAGLFEDLSTGWYRTFEEAVRELAGPELADLLAAEIDRPGNGEAARLLLADALCRAADLPFRAVLANKVDHRGRDYLPHGHAPEPFPGRPPEAAARLWREVRPLSPAGGYRRRVEEAARICIEAEDDAVRNWVWDWLMLRTDIVKYMEDRRNHRPEATRDWWEERGGEHPALWLARALGIPPPPPEEPPVETLLERAAGRDTDFAHLRYAYELLAIGLPGGGLPLADGPFRSEERFYLTARARLAGGRLPEPHVARLARLDFLPGAAAPAIGWGWAAPMGVGDVVRIDRPAPGAAAPGRDDPGIAPRLPGEDAGTAGRPGPPALADELRLTWHAGSRGITLEPRRGGAGIGVGMALPVRTEVNGSWSWTERAGGRASMWIAALDPPGAADGEDWAAWKARIERTVPLPASALPDLVRVERVQAGESPPAPGEEDGSGWRIFYRSGALIVRERGTPEEVRRAKWDLTFAMNWDQHRASALFALGEWIPVDGLDLLEGRCFWLHESSPWPRPDPDAWTIGMMFADRAFLARLLAGDASLLEGVEAWKDRVGTTRFGDNLEGQDEAARIWWRLARLSPAPSVRARAAAELEAISIPDPAAAAIAADIRAGADAPPALRDRVRWAPFRAAIAPYLRRWEVRAVMAAAVIAAAAAAVIILRARRSILARRLAAAFLVLEGMLLAAFEVRLGGEPVIPRALWYAAAALGAAALARGLAGRARLLPAAGLALARRHRSWPGSEQGRPRDGPRRPAPRWPSPSSPPSRGVSSGRRSSRPGRPASPWPSPPWSWRRRRSRASARPSAPRAWWASPSGPGRPSRPWASSSSASSGGRRSTSAGASRGRRRPAEQGEDFHSAGFARNPIRKAGKEEGRKEDLCFPHESARANGLRRTIRSARENLALPGFPGLSSSSSSV